MEYPMRECACGAVFKAVRRTQQYCSRPCANRHKPYSRSDVAPRLWAKVEKQEDGCWIWHGSHDGKGYGRIWTDGRLVPTHRVAYELLVGPIPEGLTIDHLCRVHSCLNPAHLEPVTMAENIRRGENWLGRRDSCFQGHPYTPENTYWRYGKERICKTCHYAATKRYRERKKARRANA